MDKKASLKYLEDNVLRKEISLKFDDQNLPAGEPVGAYVYLKNKIFINAYLIRSGIALASKVGDYKYKNKFIELERFYLYISS
ncbi:MAG: hypothetical protein ACPL25_09210 [Ignavibacteria bacterium]